MICFIQWRVGQLPNGRAELYQRIVATYLVALDRARKTQTSFTPDKMAYDFDDIKFWLGKLAWQMQCGQLISTTIEGAETDPHYEIKEVEIQSSDDDSENETIYEPIARITTIYQTQLCQFFATQLHDIIFGDFDENVRQQEAINEAEKLITFLKNRTGFLIPKGQQTNPDTNQNEDFFPLAIYPFRNISRHSI